MKEILAVVADTHCGSQQGLMPPEQYALDAGGFYDPSSQQKWLWGVWQEGWEIVKRLRKKARLTVVMNGDAVQGTDSVFTALVSKRAEEHEDIHRQCMDYALSTAKFDSKKGDRLFYVRGTERHSEPGSQAEERLGEDLGAEIVDGRYSSMQIQLKINDVYFDFVHRREKGGARWWTKENALFYAAKNAYANIVDKKWFKPPFDVVYLGAHFHQWIPPQTKRGPQGNVTFAISPAFQLMGGFGIQVTKGLEKASIGMLIFEIEKDGSWKLNELVYEPDHVPVVRR